MRALLLFLSLFAATSLRANPAAHKGTGLNVELIAESTSITPGKPFSVGLLIHHDRGYHTYWKNPGLAGVATNLQWSLPKGFKTGPIQWPAPEKVKMAAINTHGFESDTLLIVEITPPKNLRSTEVTLRTKASWMCCFRSCGPGFCDLALTLPVAPSNSLGPRADLFTKARSLHPVTATGWQFSALRSGNTITLSGHPLTPGLKAPAHPQFFSADNLICSHPDQLWSSSDGSFKAILTISEMPPKNQSFLRGTLTADSGWLGTRSTKAIDISVPVTPAP
jgi:DsbC/DsbD-like thiol-disulfide interchange protein